MTCVECRKNRADQMKQLLCDNKKNCEEAYQDGYNQALEDFEAKIKECCSIVGSCDYEDMERIKEQLKR